MDKLDRLLSTNTSGATGVHWHKPKGKWQARIYNNGRYAHVGYFNDVKAAIAAREAAKRRSTDR